MPYSNGRRVGMTYILEITVKLKNKLFHTHLVEFKIKKTDLLVNIIGGDRQITSSKKLVFEGIVKDLDVPDIV